MLLFPGDVKVALARIKQAIADSVLTKERIAERCHRVLKTKEWAGLHNWAPHPLEGLTEGLNDSRAQALEHRIAGEALTVLRNQNDLLPLGPDQGEAGHSGCVRRSAPRLQYDVRGLEHASHSTLRSALRAGAAPSCVGPPTPWF